MKVFVLTGPTAAGKTEIGIALAKKYELDIISADSRQIYRYFDIGTDKPGPEQRAQVKFHLIDFVEPSEIYSAADFARDALRIIKQLREQGRKFIIVGGANFYLRALFNPLFKAPQVDHLLRSRLMAMDSSQLYNRLKQIDPVRAAQLHPNDKQRIVRAIEVYEMTGKTFTQHIREQAAKTDLVPVYVVLTMPKLKLYEHIDQRFDRMMAAGLLNEVRTLRGKGFGLQSPAAQGYGYRELFLYLEGKFDLITAVKLAKKRTRDYAKRQLTWLRSLPDAYWFEVADKNEAINKIEPVLKAVYNLGN
ncbi:MAG: tRNA (adenosine(37)-N6)-dimethylallyltransferase MiaA [candidate division WOR-3 bacterium]